MKNYDTYGILAHPAGHSLSPVMQNVAFQALGISARFEVFDIAPSGLPAFFERVRREPIRGLAVSLPYKEQVFSYLDCLDVSAEKIGAVNTVKNENGALHGYNTDFLGAVSALNDAILQREKTANGFVAGRRIHKIALLRGKTVVVLGAGGVARAIVYGLCHEGAKVIILNRTRGKADALARNFGCRSGELSDISQWQPDILVNATSVGMALSLRELRSEAKQSLSAPLASERRSNLKEYFEVAPPHLLVFDVVYRPRMTKFLKLAREAGLSILPGDSMLLHQGAAQFEIWTEKKAPLAVMRKALDAGLDLSS